MAITRRSTILEVAAQVSQALHDAGTVLPRFHGRFD